MTPKTRKFFCTLHTELMLYASIPHTSSKILGNDPLHFPYTTAQIAGYFICKSKFHSLLPAPVKPGQGEKRGKITANRASSYFSTVYSVQYSVCSVQYILYSVKLALGINVYNLLLSVH